MLDSFLVYKPAKLKAVLPPDISAQGLTMEEEVHTRYQTNAEAKIERYHLAKNISCDILGQQLSIYSNYCRSSRDRL